MNWSRRLPGKDFVGGRHDGAADIGREVPGRHVGGGGGFLDEDRGGHELLGRAQAADRKVLCRPLSLNAVVGVGRNAVLAERVAFQAMHDP